MLSGDLSAASTSTLVIGAVAFVALLALVVACGVRCASSKQRGPLAANGHWSGSDDSWGGGGGFGGPGSGLTELGAWGEPHMSKRAGGAAQANRTNGQMASGFSGHGAETQRVSDGAINASKASTLYPAEMSGGVAPSFGWATANPAYPAEAAVAVAVPASRLGDPAARKAAEHDASPKPRPPPVPPPPPAAVAAAAAAAASIDSSVAEDEGKAYLAPSAQQVLMEARVAAEQAKLSKHQEGVNSV
jgi:hypothetical protein